MFDLTRVPFSKDAAGLDSDPRAGLVRWVWARSRSRLIDVMRHRAGELGMVQGIDRVLRADWVIRAVPDPINRATAELAVPFARGHDPFSSGGTGWPYARWS